MKYRADIDGLRAISVLLVIAFHAGVPGASGGFIGVDIFFVISGFLITGLISKEMEERRFSFVSFYKRRAARLLPSLAVTLAGLLIFGAFYLDLPAYDNLGKDIFFSAFGAANILFSKGQNYFVQGTEARLTIHLWSLGVEEQFYIFWPVLLLVMHKLWCRKSILTVTICLAVVSLVMSEYAARIAPVKAYYLPQYRAFELLLGAMVVLGASHLDLGRRLREALAWGGVALIAAAAILVKETTLFPGLMALLPCMGAVGVLAAGPETTVAQVLRQPFLVALGLISYPLYLFHQPIIAITGYLEPDLVGRWPVVFFMALGLGGALAWLATRFVERPIRRMAHRGVSVWRVRGVLASLVVVIGSIGVSGAAIAKGGGLPQRFALLNPFAGEVARQTASSFHTMMRRGYAIHAGQKGRILFVGDSVLQHYVVPLSQALNIPLSEVDVVSRGGCVLLRGVRFDDQFSDISCDGLRDQLYGLDKTYDLVVISQNWSSYDGRITNAPAGTGKKGDPQAKWEPFLKDTLAYFAARAGAILLIGPHPSVAGTDALKPSMMLTPEHYKRALASLQVVGRDNLDRVSERFVRSWQDSPKTTVILPRDIWCDETASSTQSGCTLSDGTWSFFTDQRHSSRASVSYAASRLRALLKGTQYDREGGHMRADIP